MNSVNVIDRVIWKFYGEICVLNKIKFTGTLHAFTPYEGVEAWMHLFLNSNLDGRV